MRRPDHRWIFHRYPRRYDDSRRTVHDGCAWNVMQNVNEIGSDHTWSDTNDSRCPDGMMGAPGRWVPHQTGKGSPGSSACLTHICSSFLDVRALGFLRDCSE